MKKLIFAFLLMAGSTVQADNVCNRCEIIDVAPQPGTNPTGTYVGAFWSHDRATFVNPSMVDFYGSHSYWANYVILDLEETVDVTITATPNPRTEFLGFTSSGAAFQMSVHPAVTFCGGGTQCLVGLDGSIVLALVPTWDGSKRISATTENVPPGRYGILFQGYTNYVGENGYSGKIVVKRPRR